MSSKFGNIFTLHTKPARKLLESEFLETNIVNGSLRTLNGFNIIGNLCFCFNFGNYTL